MPGALVIRARFWGKQVLRMAILLAVVGGLLWAWKSTGHDIGAPAGWIAAGIAVAAQRVITSFAGYLILLPGNVFTVGDRITIGGVRGDVVSLGFMQTTVMEMGQTPAEQSDDPSMWIRARQYSGRIVRVTNDKIFDTPVYNYTRDFQFLWEEVMVPVAYGDPYERVEAIMRDATTKHTASIVEQAKQKLPKLEKKYFHEETPRLEPKVYLRITDNWIELSARYLAPARGSRELSDAINRDILAAMIAEGIAVASVTQTITVVGTES
jgi:small-conductance mechanosensitive channel